LTGCSRAHARADDEDFKDQLKKVDAAGIKLKGVIATMQKGECSPLDCVKPLSMFNRAVESFVVETNDLDDGVASTSYPAQCLGGGKHQPKDLAKRFKSLQCECSDQIERAKKGDLASLAELDALGASIGFDAEMVAAVLAGVDGNVVQCAAILRERETTVLEDKTRQLERENLEAVRRMQQTMLVALPDGADSSIARKVSEDMPTITPAAQEAVPPPSAGEAVPPPSARQAAASPASPAAARGRRSTARASCCCCGARPNQKAQEARAVSNGSSPDDTPQTPETPEERRLRVDVELQAAEKQSRVITLQAAERQSSDPFVQKKLSIQAKIADTKEVRTRRTTNKPKHLTLPHTVGRLRPGTWRWPHAMLRVTHTLCTADHPPVHRHSIFPFGESCWTPCADTLSSCWTRAAWRL